MNATLYFELELEYQTSQYDNLMKLAVEHTYDKDIKKFRWLFPLNKIKQVMSCLVKPIEFTNEKENIETIIELCPPIFKKIPASRWKGLGEYSFVEETEIFKCGEWQKDNNGIPVQRWTDISKQKVVDIWNIISKQPLNKKIKVNTISENYCRLFNLNSFFRESGTFQWKKFWGGHRKTYMPYIYWPLKILDNLGFVTYDKTGRVARIKNTLEFQTKFKNYF